MPRMAVLAVLALAVLAAQAHPGEYSPLEHVNVAAVKVGARGDDVTISATPDSIAAGAANITVSWTTASPQHGDFIGLYLTTDKVTETAPAKYQYADYAASHAASGSGNFTFRVLNMRADAVFYYFRGGISSPVVAATSNIVKVENPSMPMQGRLALTNSSDAMQISWTSIAGLKGEVQYRTENETAYKSAAASSATYTRSELCGAPATTVGFRNPGTFYSAIMTGLPPATKIFYKYGSGDAFSPERWFVSAPAPGSAVRAFAFGDLGQHDLDNSLQQEDMAPSRNTTDAMASEMDGRTLVIHDGDISYARGYVSQWEQFHDQIEPIATRMPWMSAAGNHEYDWPNSTTVIGDTDSGGECGLAYDRRFNMPGTSRGKPWYSYSFGVLFVIVISTEHDFAYQSEQYYFVKSALESVDRSKTPWVIFAGHRPFLIDSTNNDPPSGDQPVATNLRKAFEHLLYEHKVDLQFGAHHHSYQRSCPMYKLKCMSPDASGYAAPVIVDLGMAGAGNSQNIDKVKPEVFEYVDDTHHGYTRIAANMTHFSLEYVRGRDKEVADSFTLVHKQ